MSQNHFHFLGVNSWILETFWETLKRLENPWKPLTESWRKNFGCLGCKPCWTGHVGRPYNDPGWKPRVCTLVGSSYEGRGVSLSWIDLQDIHIRKRATPILTLRETLCDPKKGQWTIFWKCHINPRPALSKVKWPWLLVLKASWYEISKSCISIPNYVVSGKQSKCVVLCLFSKIIYTQ